jgi:O-antigen/teichoic acid export membrane protein
VLTLGTKVISILQQYLIAHFFLSPEDFGLVALGQVVISLASIGQHLGLSEIMARRHRTFEEWAQAAIWMSLAGALVCITLIFSICPFWDQIYTTVSTAFTHHPPSSVPHIQYLLAIWCLGLPFDAVATIFNARLRADMRFRAWAMIACVQTLGIAAISLVLAAFHLGAYALVIPIPIMMMVCSCLSRYYSGQKVRLFPQFGLWGRLLGDALYFFGGNVFNVLLQQGDYLITGFFFKQEVLGAYYFAFRMSSQTAQLINANLATILVPSFARLDQERGRQIAAYERTCSVLLLIGIPICGLQSILGEPLFNLLFGTKWELAAPLFAILSLAMGFAIPMSTALALLIAQGRLRTNMIITISQSIMFVTFVVTGALFGDVKWVATFVALFYLLFGPLTVALPVVGSGVSVARFLLRIHWFPVLAGAFSTAAAWVLTTWWAPPSNLVTILIRLAVWGILMTLLLLIVRPPAAREIAPRFAALARRLIPGRRTP